MQTHGITGMKALQSKAKNPLPIALLSLSKSKPLLSNPRSRETKTKEKAKRIGQVKRERRMQTHRHRLSDERQGHLAAVTF